jgi:preprotein translocase subunit SecF
MELFKNPNIDFLGRKVQFIGLSLVVTAIGLASWIYKGSLKYGLDFTGGASVTVRFSGPPPIDRIRSAVSARMPGELSVQEVTGENSVIIGTSVQGDQELQRARGLIVEALEGAFGEKAGGKLDINNAGAQALADRLRDPLAASGAALNDQALQDLAKAVMEYKNTPPRSGLLKSFDELSGVAGVTPAVVNALKQHCSIVPFSIRGAEVIGPKIGGEIRTKAVLATFYALGGMLVYLAFRFEWIYGLAAVIAVFHDVVITLGFFSLFDKEISLNVVAAILTLVGYSMNDTIVVFDRIREKLKTSRRESLDVIINRSINETLSRTVMTSGLTFLSCLALYFFGGSVLHGFSFALVVGIIVGTYSSIFVASPILVFWNNLREGRKGPAASAAAGGKDAVRKK